MEIGIWGDSSSPGWSSLETKKLPMNSFWKDNNISPNVIVDKDRSPWGDSSESRSSIWGLQPSDPLAKTCDDQEVPGGSQSYVWPNPPPSSDTTMSNPLSRPAQQTLFPNSAEGTGNEDSVAIGSHPSTGYSSSVWGQIPLPGQVSNDWQSSAAPSQPWNAQPSGLWSPKQESQRLINGPTNSNNSSKEDKHTYIQSELSKTEGWGELTVDQSSTWEEVDDGPLTPRNDDDSGWNDPNRPRIEARGRNGDITGDPAIGTHIWAAQLCQKVPGNDKTVVKPVKSSRDKLWGDDGDFPTVLGDQMWRGGGRETNGFNPQAWPLDPMKPSQSFANKSNMGPFGLPHHNTFPSSSSEGPRVSSVPSKSQIPIPPQGLPRDKLPSPLPHPIELATRLGLIPPPLLGQPLNHNQVLLVQAMLHLVATCHSLIPRKQAVQNQMLSAPNHQQQSAAQKDLQALSLHIEQLQSQIRTLQLNLLPAGQNPVGIQPPKNKPQQPEMFLPIQGGGFSGRNSPSGTVSSRMGQWFNPQSQAQPESHQLPEPFNPPPPPVSDNKDAYSNVGPPEFRPGVPWEGLKQFSNEMTPGQARNQVSLNRIHDNDILHLTSDFNKLNSRFNHSPVNNNHNTFPGVSPTLILRNLSPQIDGNTLRTVCMQHGPLKSFNLNLASGLAIATYTSVSDAIKAQQGLNNCPLGNATIVAELAAPSPPEQQQASPVHQFGGPPGGFGGHLMGGQFASRMAPPPPPRLRGGGDMGGQRVPPYQGGWMEGGRGQQYPGHWQPGGDPSI